jgi:WD40 repeat protein
MFPRQGRIVLLVGMTLAFAIARATAESPPTDRYGDPLPEHAVARLGTVRMRHSDTINSAAFSPDGKLLASGGDDQFVYLWDVATGKEVGALPHPNPVRTVLFTPDGKTLVSASNQNDDTRVHLWEVKSKKEVRSLAMPKPNGLAHMVLSRDGKTLFTSTVLGPVVSWDLARGNEVWRAEDDKAWSKCLALSPDGKMLATGTSDGKVYLMDGLTGKFVKSVPTDRHRDIFADVLSLAFSPDGRTLALTDQVGDLRCWDVSAGKWTRQVELGASIVAPLAFSPDGKTLACGSEQTLHLYDPAAGRELTRREGHESWIRSVAFSPDGRLLASAGQDKVVRIWDVPTLKPHHPFTPEPGGTCSASFRPDGSRLISSHWSSGQAWDYSAFTSRPETCTRRAWDARSVGALRERKPEPCMSGAGCLSPDGKVFARSDEDGLVRLVDANSGKDLRTVGKKGRAFTARAVAFSADGQVVAVVSNELGAVITHGWEALERLRLWDVTTGKLVATAIEDKQLKHVWGVRFASKGPLLVAIEGGRASPGLHLWRLDRGKSLRPVSKAEPPDEGSPVPSPDGWLLITLEEVGARENQGDRKAKQVVRVREVISGKEVLCLENQSGVCRFALSPDNRLLALGDEEGAIRLADVGSGKVVQSLRGHRGGIASLDYSADGALLVSGSEDTTALVWDVRSLFPREVADKAVRLKESLWDDLAGDDAVRAFRAEQALRASPERGIDLLKRHLRPVPRLDPKAVQTMIDDLDNNQFEVRERAMNRLRDLEQTAVPLLKKALATSGSAEARRRLKQLLVDAEEPRSSPERMGDLRAVHCLRILGTEPARQLLQALANGAPEARLTQEADEELKWLK